MTRKKVGLVVFWIGAVYLFVTAWLVMWWIAPIWRNSPPEQFEGTALAFGGPVFIAISLGGSLGSVLAPIGILLYAHDRDPTGWPVRLFVAGGLLVALSMMLLPTLGYYPVVFGVAGGAILLLFFSALWQWAKRCRVLEGTARTAADCQLASYVFFLLAAIVACAAFGNPFGGLFFPEKILADNAMSWYYAMGTKIAVYFALGWLFTFLSNYLFARSAPGLAGQHA